MAALPISSFTLAAALGVAAEAVLSRIHEVPTGAFLITHSTAAIALFSVLLQTLPLRLALPHFTNLACVYTLSLVGATLVYRLHLHPLRRFPGPKLAALTKLYDVYEMRDGKRSLRIRKLHRKHGDIVRTGPNEVCICNVEALPQIYPRQMGYKNRGAFYQYTKLTGGDNVFSQRDPRVHKQWRGIWDAAFRTQALRDYEPRVERHVDGLVRALRRSGGTEMVVNPVVENFAYDVMADLGFGVTDGTQDGSGDPEFMPTLRKYAKSFALIGHLRNLTDILYFVPASLKNSSAMTEFKARGAAMLARRMAAGKTIPDVFSRLLDEDDESGVRFTPAELGAQARFMIGAGADTTSTTLVNIFRELGLNPHIQQRLHGEIETVPKPITPDSVKNLPYLSAVVDEGLRLYNAVPSGTQTITGPTGATIHGEFIPPGTSVYVPLQALLTDERYFSQGDKFWPERWTQPELGGVKEKKAFVPFSYGAHSCAGKQLALMEMKLAIARVVEEFELVMGEGYDEAKWWEGWSDFFTLNVGDVPMKFVPRS